LNDLEEVSEDVKQILLSIIEENVKISTVNISGKIKLSFSAENGIDLIKESLIEAQNIIDSKVTRGINISYIAAPLYRLEIVSKDYLDAENILSDALEIIEQKKEQYNGSFEFIRD
jgi:translation initiation factor 2 subunit 1